MTADSIMKMDSAAPGLASLITWPGGMTSFLRADGSFAALPIVSGVYLKTTLLTSGTSFITSASTNKIKLRFQAGGGAASKKTTGAGTDGSGFGSGGGGALSLSLGAAQAGGAGMPGMIIVDEFT